MKFVKMHGTGNDFVLVEARGEEKNWPEMAIAMCNRHFGIGADGLILILPSQVADARMRIFNADGSEAEMCGNGIRCFAKYIVEKGMVSAKDEIAIETLAGIRRVKVERAGDIVRSVRVNMGAPRFKPGEIPMILDTQQGRGKLDITYIMDYPLVVDGRRIEVSCVSMGNPHAVYFIDGPVEEFPLHEIGPKVEHHPAFPKRVNFEVAQVIGGGKIRVRVWERGSGETMACGTGACAVAVMAIKHGLIKNRAEVVLSGGSLDIEWDGVGEVFMSGPAEMVFTGEWSERI